MGVAHGGVGDEQLFLTQHPVAHGFGALFVQQLLESRAERRFACGKRGVSYCWRSASGFATWMLAIYFSTRVARSRESAISKSSGVSSMNFVWHLPATNVGWCRMLVTKGMLVLTPRTWTSLMARIALRQAPWKVLSQLVTLTSRES